MGAWVLDADFSADRVARFAAAGATGVLVPRGADEAGWMPKMVAGPAPAALPVLAVRADVHEAMAAALASGSAWAAASAPVRTADAMGTNVYGEFGAGALGNVAILLTAHSTASATTRTAPGSPPRLTTPPASRG